MSHTYPETSVVGSGTLERTIVIARNLTEQQESWPDTHVWLSYSTAADAEILHHHILVSVREHVRSSQPHHVPFSSVLKAPLLQTLGSSPTWFRDVQPACAPFSEVAMGAWASCYTDVDILYQGRGICVRWSIDPTVPEGGTSPARLLIMRYLRERHLKERQSLVEALARQREEFAVEAVVILRGAASASVIDALEELLISIGAPSTSWLQQVAVDPSEPEQVRASLLNVLAVLQHGAALQCALRASTDPAPIVRETAVEILGEFGSFEEARQTLHGLLSDPNEAVREAAQAELENLAEGGSVIA